MDVRLQSVINSFKLEGMDPTPEEIEVCQKILDGELNANDVINDVIERYRNGEAH